RALEQSSVQLGATHPDTLAAALALAIVLYKDQSRLADAEPLYRRVIEGREEQLGAKRFSTVLCLAGLLEAQGGQGRLVEAETLYRRVLNERETLLGASHPGTLRAVHYLAKMLNKLDKRDEAEPL
ncbi:hypothetical protein T492DRAFT_561617, partial [Pavlovales sp. CCMP2436]